MTPGPATSGPGAGDPTLGGTADPGARPMAVSLVRIVLWGMIGWAVALVVVLLVPAWHEGDRSWWPTTCILGLALGALGVFYLRRGRGSVAERKPATTEGRGG